MKLPGNGTGVGGYLSRCSFAELAMRLKELIWRNRERERLKSVASPHVSLLRNTFVFAEILPTS